MFLSLSSIESVNFIEFLEGRSFTCDDYTPSFIGNLIGIVFIASVLACMTHLIIVNFMILVYLFSPLDNVLWVQIIMQILTGLLLMPKFLDFVVSL